MTRPGHHDVEEYYDEYEEGDALVAHPRWQQHHGAEVNVAAGYAYEPEEEFTDDEDEATEEVTRTVGHNTNAAHRTGETTRIVDVSQQSRTGVATNWRTGNAKNSSSLQAFTTGCHDTLWSTAFWSTVVAVFAVPVMLYKATSGTFCEQEVELASWLSVGVLGSVPASLHLKTVSKYYLSAYCNRRCSFASTLSAFGFLWLLCGTALVVARGCRLPSCDKPWVWGVAVGVLALHWLGFGVMCLPKLGQMCLIGLRNCCFGRPKPKMGIH
ncbi:unnamed protein product [Amoebophrya sp. A25]|nr:unnamed protein product [Amoebophrya sp. A25]|eukprot:GSA25T00026862001.1